ncbi:MAG TPA: hypothetical protein VD905_10375, partial [Flavobacteriales bacterium]|nr:hypothetical protein [Flavobacteriales bacterium]
MKKTLLLGLALLGFTMGKSQDAADKKFRFGLKAMPSVNWLKIDDEKTYEKGGAAMKFGYGLLTEFKITDVAWFNTGLQVDYDGGKWKSKDSVAYYINSDNELLENEKIKYDDTNSTAGYSPYGILNRSYRSMYLTIPLSLRLKTKEIGYLTYFGGFGFLTSIHIRTKVDDEVESYITGTKSTLEKVDASKDMNILRFGLTLNGGVEMNLSGSTSLMFGLAFNQY